jgi:Protein of unknown function (DUF1207)
MKKIVLLWALIGTIPCVAQWFPKGDMYFEPLLLDPLEAQTYGTVGQLSNGSYNPAQVPASQLRDYPAIERELNALQQAGTYAPFAIGWGKRLVAWEGERFDSEIVVDLAAFSQFAFREVSQKSRRYILNTDFKVSVAYQLRRDAHSLRLRLYHLSSHLGDDYLFIQQINTPTENPVNYEQLDLTYSHTSKRLRTYAGLGVGIRPQHVRKRLSVQAGTLFRQPINAAESLSVVLGADLKLWEETQFHPNVKAAVGLRIGDDEARPVHFLIEYYRGKLPYSQYLQQQVAWWGAGLYLTIF